jgi:hypothetical protein
MNRSKWQYDYRHFKTFLLYTICWWFDEYENKTCYVQEHLFTLQLPLLTPRKLQLRFVIVMYCMTLEYHLCNVILLWHYNPCRCFNHVTVLANEFNSLSSISFYYMYLCLYISVSIPRLYCQTILIKCQVKFPYIWLV